MTNQQIAEQEEKDTLKTEAKLAEEKRLNNSHEAGASKVEPKVEPKR